MGNPIRKKLGDYVQEKFIGKQKGGLALYVTKGPTEKNKLNQYSAEPSRKKKAIVKGNKGWVQSHHYRKDAKGKNDIQGADIFKSLWRRASEELRQSRTISAALVQELCQSDPPAGANGAWGENLSGSLSRSPEGGSWPCCCDTKMCALKSKWRCLDSSRHWRAQEEMDIKRLWLSQLGEGSTSCGKSCWRELPSLQMAKHSRKGMKSRMPLSQRADRLQHAPTPCGTCIVAKGTS